MLSLNSRGRAGRSGDGVYRERGRKRHFYPLVHVPHACSQGWARLRPEPGTIQEPLAGWQGTKHLSQHPLSALLPQQEQKVEGLRSLPAL